MLSWSWITDKIATGARINEQSDLDRLAKGGITHVLNLCELTDFDAFTGWAMGVHGARREFAEGPSSSFPFVYLWNPTADDGLPKPTSWFKTSFDFAMPALVKGKCYIHCKAGYNRGPSTCYFLLRVFGWSPWHAKRRIWLKRPITFPFGMRYIPDAERALAELRKGWGTENG